MAILAVSRIRVAILLGLVGAHVGVPPASAQDDSAELARSLASLMTDRELGALAAKDPSESDRYVATLAFPGQLLVVSARYEVPVLLDQKIENGDYREVYIDLNAASVAGSKVLVTDVGADGFGTGGAADVFDDGATVLRLDGDNSGGTAVGRCLSRGGRGRGGALRGHAPSPARGGALIALRRCGTLDDVKRGRLAQW